MKQTRLLFCVCTRAKLLEFEFGHFRYMRIWSTQQIHGFLWFRDLQEKCKCIWSINKNVQPECSMWTNLVIEWRPAPGTKIWIRIIHEFMQMQHFLLYEFEEPLIKLAS